ncbi:POC1 centriolar protein homolog A isoform X2 [Orussus abietinus]|nr:POC1 centriolar protein homolog A isoform X2 [Orussus abietinus]
MGAVRSVRFSPDGKKLITASNDKSIKLWVLSRKKFLTSFMGHTNWVNTAKFSPDGRLVVSCSDDKKIKLWDTVSGRNVKTFHEVKEAASDVEFHPSGAAIGTANIGGSIKVYDLRTACLYQHYDCHKGPVSKIRFHPNGNFMLTASWDSTMKILDLLEGRPIYTLKGHSGRVTAIQFSTCGEHFISGGSDKQLFMWKSNFDKDDVIRKIPRRLIPCNAKLKLDSELSSESTIDNDFIGQQEIHEQDESESLSTYIDELSIERSLHGRTCTGPFSDMPRDEVDAEVINMRNMRNPGRGRVATLSLCEHGTRSTYKIT